MALSVRWIGSLSILLIVVGGIVPQAQPVHFTGTQITLHIGSLDSPQGMAIDLSGNIYVTDNASNSILKLTPSGALSTGFIRGDGSPYGVAVDRSGGLYITDNVKNEVIKETPQPDGSYTKSVLPLSDLNSPLGIAVDVHGNVYIADHLNSRIVKAAPSGGSYTQSSVPTSTLSLPKGVAVDGFGNLYIADTAHWRVLKETPSETGYFESTVVTLKSSGSEEPIAVAADSAGDIFILEYFSDLNFVVVKERLSGGAYTQSTLANSGQDPSAIATDANADVYIASPGKDRLVKLVGEQPADFGAVKVGNADAATSFIISSDTQSSLPCGKVLTRGCRVLGLCLCSTCSALIRSCVIVSAGACCTLDLNFRPQVQEAGTGCDLRGSSSELTYLRPLMPSAPGWDRGYASNQEATAPMAVGS